MKNKEYFRNTKISMVFLSRKERLKLKELLEKLKYDDNYPFSNILNDDYLYIGANGYQTGTSVSSFVNRNFKELKYNNMFTSLKYKLK